MLDERLGKELLYRLIRELSELNIHLPEINCLVYSFTDVAEILRFTYADNTFEIKFFYIAVSGLYEFKVYRNGIHNRFYDYFANFYFRRSFILERVESLRKMISED